MNELRESRTRQPDSEKITINMGFVDLGGIDLLVREGFYSNRSDFIRTAVRNQIQHHAEVIRRSVTRQDLELGIRHCTRTELESLRSAGEKLSLQVLGLLVIAPDVSPDLARDTISSVRVLGSIQAPADVKEALAGRIH